jgi:glutamate carboxypeptidase
MKQELNQIISEFIDGHREEMLSLWQEIVNMESGSGYKEGIDAVARRFQQVLDGSGAVTRIVEMEKAGNMLIGEVGAGRAKPAVLFMGQAQEN